MPGQSSDISIGPYVGCVAGDLSGRIILPDDGRVSMLTGFPTAGSYPPGGSFFFKTTLCIGGRTLPVHVKSFGRQSLLKDLMDRRIGSGARRSWKMALTMLERGVDTPRPIAFLERWEQRRLAESYLFTEFQEQDCTLKEELIRLYMTDPDCSKIMALLECVAKATRRLHDQGIFHRDLGNQNILVRPGCPSTWPGVQFVDLNRARLRSCVSLAERAFDISRIALPSDFLRVFKEMYFDDVVPSAFQQLEKKYRERFAIHTRTRAWRHPLRARDHLTIGNQSEYPADKDTWVWDERSAQAISPFTARDRRKMLSIRNHIQVAAATVGGALSVRRSYRAVMARCFRNPVMVAGRIGMAINPAPLTLERELGLLRPLGKIPVLIRFYRHDGRANWEFCAGVVRRLASGGHLVSIALVQDRIGVNVAAKWTEFVEYVLSRVSDCVDFVEVGHAINRSKWGIWTLDEHRRMMEATALAAGRYPGLKFMGPAAIDFDYPFAMAALRNMPGGFRFDAFSQHLYVDRRGAPESRQGPFSTLEKCALGRAVAENSPGCAGRFVISEVNWPIVGTGVFSPVGSPYVSPGPRFGDPSVSEEIYADYMIRYLLIACCSGTVERVYWWRLVAQGFGLVDDSVPGEWRERIAYRALLFFLNLLGDGTFVEKVTAPYGAEVFLFATASGSKVALAYSTTGVTQVKMPFSFSQALDIVGRKKDAMATTTELSGSPLYLMDVSI